MYKDRREGAMKEGDVIAFTNSKLALYYKMLQHVYNDLKEKLGDLASVEIEDSATETVTTALIAAQLALHVLIEYDRQRNRKITNYRRYKEKYRKYRRRW